MSRASSATAIDDPGFVAEFRDVFLRRGWRGIERNYGCDSSVLLRLIAAAGGDALLAERAAIQPCGRKAGAGRSAPVMEVMT